MLTANTANVVIKNSRSPPTIVRAGLRKLLFKKTMYNLSVRVFTLDKLKTDFFCLGLLPSTKAASTGIKKRATNKDINKVEIIETPMFLPIMFSR